MDEPRLALDFQLAMPGEIAAGFVAHRAQLGRAQPARAPRHRHVAQQVVETRAVQVPAVAVRVLHRVAVHRYPLAWHVTLFMGLQSLLYYAALSWLPTILRDRGASADTAGNLLALMSEIKT